MTSRSGRARTPACDYRREMVAVLAGRALREAARRAGDGHADRNGHRP